MTENASAVYLDHITSLKDDEIDRRSVLEGRGGAIAASSSGLLALVLAVTIFISGADLVFRNSVAIILLIVSGILFIVAAIAGAIVQGFSFKHSVTSLDTVGKMIDEHWSDLEAAARKQCARRLKDTISTLRSGNDSKALVASIAIGVQIVAVAFLSTSLAVEIATHPDAGDTITKVTLVPAPPE